MPNYSKSTPAGPEVSAPKKTYPDPSANQSCKFFQSGSCRFGASCRFQHPSGGLQSSNQIQQNTPSSNTCLYFAQGRCNQGTNCKFSHNI